LSRRVVYVILGVAVAFALLLVVGGVSLVFAIFAAMDRTPAHVCALAMVQRSPVAVRLVGQPVVQKGFTGGETSTANGEMHERVTFNVTGPRGQAFVLSEGSRSPLASQLTVTIGRNQRSVVVYSGPFDCPELHERR
jgi:hypothetical protein